MPFLTAVPTGPGVATPGASPGNLGDAASIAKALAASGLIPPASGITTPSAVPGMQWTAGISGAQQAPTPRGVSGAETGLGTLLARATPDLSQPVPSLGYLLKGGA